jgi:hypothetical protein
MNGFWDHKVCKHKGKQRQDCSTDQVWAQQPFKTDTTIENGYYLCVSGHLRCEEDDGNKGKQCGELVDKEGQKVEVIVKNNRF